MKEQLEETGYVRIHNFPPSPNTYSYLTRIYRKFVQGEWGWKEVEGEPIYLHTLNSEQYALAAILGNAQLALDKSLPR